MSETKNQSSWVLSNDLYGENKMYKEKGIFIELTNSIPSYHQIHGRNIRERDHFPRHSGVQRRKIKKIIHFGHQNSLQTYWNFQHTHFNSCHQAGVKNGSIKGEAMRVLRANTSKTTFEESLVKFKQQLRTHGYPKTRVNFAARPSALTQKKKANERILPFVTTYHPAVNNLKQTLMEQ